MANPIVVFGDSNAVGHGVTAGQDWPSLLASVLGVTKTMKASGGHMAADQAWLLYGVSPVDTMDYLLSIGTNDAQVYGADAVKRAAYVDFMRAIAVWCAAPSRVNARSMSVSGGWYDTPVNSIGRKTNISGATATATVSGTSVYAAYILQNHIDSEGTFEILVDGVVKKTVVMNGTAIGNTQVGQSYAPACVRVGGLSSGSHVVQIRTVGTKTVHFEWVAGSDQIAKPRIFVGDVVKRTATGYASSSNNDTNVAYYGSAAHAMADELAADGLNVSKVYLNSAFNPATHLQADGIHYNPAGHIVVKDAFASIVSPVSTVSYPYRGGSISLDIEAGEVVKLTVQ